MAPREELELPTFRLTEIGGTNLSAASRVASGNLKTPLSALVAAQPKINGHIALPVLFGFSNLSRSAVETNIAISLAACAPTPKTAASEAVTSGQERCT
jgi:hypothetical protein